ncbi:winged helix DNA-binding protein [Sphingomonas sp. HITSZ_GF]|uniref:MarR family winged helix-turn-helix transcriptional regulator n=1 Tax=Sphingomonas sp. HITSZ_GF TaxID=3037247 RepID=UPI00240DA168|nr:MarR family transcriptional regulator [Sphingomonas sp. HITSZ_GF]MDG2534059.1 winged helix DNA-binding protein [Sphingomonas sp. HITSZ_GF]
MSDDAPSPLLQVAMPALLRHARHTYGAAMRAALAERGYDDIPGNGLYVIGALALGEAPLSQIIRELRVSKQAAGQLVDALVLRGYLDRQIDPEDRRRLTVTLTERGRAAADTQIAAREAIDATLAERLDAEKLHHAREVLATLIEIGREADTG